MVHHIPYPIKFFREMHKILKKDGKLIIQEAYCSIAFQLITILMRHEGFDFTKDVWSETSPVTDDNDLWAGNIAIPHLVFDEVRKQARKRGVRVTGSEIVGMIPLEAILLAGKYFLKEQRFVPSHKDVNTFLCKKINKKI